MKEFVLEILRQLFGWSAPRSGKLILTRYAFKKMNEHGLDTDTLADVFEHGEEVKKNMIIKKYLDYQVGIVIKLNKNNFAENQFLVITCWKREVW